MEANELNWAPKRARHALHPPKHQEHPLRALDHGIIKSFDITLASPRWLMVRYILLW